MFVVLIRALEQSYKSLLCLWCCPTFRRKRSYETVSVSRTVFLKNGSQDFSEILHEGKGQKLRKLIFQKNSHFREKAYIFLQTFAKNSIHWCVFFTPKMVHNSVLHDSAKTPCLGKIWFFSYGLKCFHSILLQYSLTINVSGRNQAIF